MKRCMSPEEVAKIYGVSRQTVWRWIRTGKLSAVRIGGAYYIRTTDLEDMERNFCTAAAAIGGTV